MITVSTPNGLRQVSSQGTVLESLEKSGIQHRSHCRDGICGLCKCKAKGKVSYNTDPLAYMREGEILPCVSVADSDLEMEV